MKNILRIIILSLFIPTYAFAWCSEPRAPSAPSTYSKPSKPSVPFCVNEFSNTHTCDDWTINSYQNDLRNYQYEVERFIDDLQDYLRDAQDYVNCEIRSLN